MRTLLVSVVVGGALMAARPAVAAPPDDPGAYCRSINPHPQVQVRCLYTERAAQARATQARASVAPDAWARCTSGSTSWTSMETCLAQPVPPGAGPTAAGGEAPRAGGTERGEASTDPSGAAAPGATAAIPAPGAPGAESPDAAASASTSTPSTVILGPRATTTSGAAEPNRVTRPVPESEAERQLKSVLERTGESPARCTKKQYSGGWVTVCE